MTTVIPTTPIALAYHEAGHAVLAVRSKYLKLDGPVSFQKAECPAAIDWSTVPDAERAKACYELCIAAAAGMEAEIQYHIVSGSSYEGRVLFMGAHGDVSLIRSIFDSGSIGEFRSLARTRLLSVWPVVDQVAQHLINISPSDLGAEEATRLVNTCFSD